MFDEVDSSDRVGRDLFWFFVSFFLQSTLCEAGSALVTVLLQGTFATRISEPEAVAWTMGLVLPIGFCIG